jgi:bacillithiol biosynthesis cysteine-adding enzyme BshC
MPVASEQSEKTAAVPLDQIGARALYKAFVRHDPAVRAWYPHDPFRPISVDSTQYPAERRAQVAEILEDQNRSLGAHDAVLRNIERFRAGAAAIVTGQQVGLYGGPLYSVLKALTAIKIAEEQTAHGIDAVPFFWLATEDHDLDEVRFVNVLTPDHKVQKLQLSIPNSEARVGDVELSHEIVELNRELRNLLGDSEIVSLVHRCYAPGETFGSAYARFFSTLFRDCGLIVIDNRDARLHQIAQPIFSSAASRANELSAALIRRSSELATAGFHAQVHVDQSSTFLFHYQNGKRLSIKNEGGTYKAGRSTWTSQELSASITMAPQDFSANALLRPVIQDFLLPTAAYVGGAAEIAYFAQSEVLYRELLGRVTPIVPRVSATLIEPAAARLLEKYDLEPQEVFVPAEQSRLSVSQRTLPRDVTASLARSNEIVDSQLLSLEATIAAADPTLRDAAKNAGNKMRYQLKRLGERAARAQLRRVADMDRQLTRLSNSLYPAGTLQEREIGGVYFLGKYGQALLRRIYDSVRLGTADHQFIWL